MNETAFTLLFHQDLRTTPRARSLLRIVVFTVPTLIASTWAPLTGLVIFALIDTIIATLSEKNTVVEDGVGVS